MSGHRRGQLKKIAVTGGIGSGKSTLVRQLSALGYPIFDADILVSQVVIEPQIQHQIKQLLGDEAYQTSNSGEKLYQRSWVRERVFHDPEVRRSLEQIIHPAIFDKFAKVCAQINQLVGGVWVFYEAALIFESGRERDFDAVVSVVASEVVRRERLAKSRSLSNETISAIFSAQVADDVRRSKSHFIIENSGDAGDLSRQIFKLLESLRNFFHPQSH